MNNGFRILGGLSLLVTVACNKVIQGGADVGFAQATPNIGVTNIPGPRVDNATPTPTPSPTPIGLLSEPTPTPIGTPVITTPTPTPHVNRAPTVSDIRLSVYPNQTITFALAGSDVDGDALTYSHELFQHTHGVFTELSSNTYRFRFSSGAALPLPVTFTYSASDGALSSNTATITLTFLNHLPTVTNVTFTMGADNTLTGNVTGADADGDTLLYYAEYSGSNTLYFTRPTGAFDFRSKVGPSPDNFRFRAYDGKEYSEWATVSIVPPAAADTSTLLVTTLGTKDRSPSTGALPQGQRSLLRTSSGDLWFVQEGMTTGNLAVASPAKADAFRYAKLNPSTNVWEAQTVNGLPFVVNVNPLATEPAINFMMDDIIYSYGKSSVVGMDSLFECQFDTRTRAGQCGVPTSFASVPFSLHQNLGGAMSSLSQRVLWLSNDTEFVYLYRGYDQTAWTAVRRPMACLGGLRNVQGRFFATNRLLLVGNCSKDGLDTLVSLPIEIGTIPGLPQDMSALDASTAAAAGGARSLIAGHDLWIDDNGGIHILAGTNNGFEVYLRRAWASGQLSASQVGHVFPTETKTARFVHTRDKLIVVRALVPSTTAAFAIHKLPMASAVGTLDFTTATNSTIARSALNALNGKFDYAGAILVENQDFQEAVPSVQSFLFKDASAVNGQYVFQLFGF